MCFLGVYVTLLVSSLSVMFKRRSSNRAVLSAWIFFIGVLLMFIVATLHVGEILHSTATIFNTDNTMLVLAMYRFVQGYILQVNPKGGIFYLFDLARWDSILTNALLGIILWLGDALVISRCYYIWDRNFWVILLPSLLFLSIVGKLLSVRIVLHVIHDKDLLIGINTSTLYWSTHLSDPHLNPKLMLSLLNAVYPLALTQNVLTTGLIAFKIWLQHRTSSAFGVVDRGSRLSLMRILVIVVESAMIYTLQLFILIILYFMENNVQYIVQSAIVPSVGIVFALIAVRVHIAQSTSTLGTGLGTLPAWLDESGGAIELSNQRPSSPVITGVTFIVGANDLDRDDDLEPFDSLSHSPKRDKLPRVV
ncbi:hypothetical protein CVT25_011251 [Psilocybe cyanescens]|uniref:Uncharacterized protein n=1 Tax=Psilocybe cyanescens TaxID=93625 RepID=A0A409X0X6_PSICY|nr:hypothetical protein CVT25_011251 [Psilocybe cyanescens]